MKKFFVFLFFSLSILNAKILDRIITTVNDQPIFYSEFQERIEPFLGQINENIKDEKEREKAIKKVKKDVLDSLIEEKVLLSEANKEKIKVTSSEIDQGIAELRGRFETEEDFQKELKKQNLTLDDLKRRVRDQLKVIKLIDMKVKSKVEIPSEEALKKFYQENEDKMVVGEQVRVKQIFFEFKKGVGKAGLKEKARKVLSLCKKHPEKFEEYAQKYSDAPENVGDTGYFGRGEKIPEFEEPCFKLKVGEISDIIETPIGYHIVKCIGKKAPEKKNFEESREYIKNYLMTLNMEDAYAAYVRQLRDQATIKILDKSLIE